MVKNLAILSMESPLFQQIGQPLDEEDFHLLAMVALVQDEEELSNHMSVIEMASQWEEKHSAELNKPAEASLMVVQQWGAAQSKVNALEFKTHVLDYAAEWEQVVAGRCNREIKYVKQLASDRTHYEKKVESLRNTVDRLESKGKKRDAQSEKLDRNEEKLKEAFVMHEAAAARLCVLIEEVTKNGWKDLFPLVKNVLRWEINRVGRESDIYSKLPTTLEALKTAYKKAEKKLERKTSSKNLPSRSSHKEKDLGKKSSHKEKEGKDLSSRSSHKEKAESSTERKSSKKKSTKKEKEEAKADFVVEEEVVAEEGKPDFVVEEEEVIEE